MGLCILLLIFGILYKPNPIPFPWHLTQIEVEGAWAVSGGGNSNITVEILDSGIDFSHPDLVHAQWVNPDEIPDNGLDDDENGYIDDIAGWDFLSGDNTPGPQPSDPIHWHGTAIAGIIAAKRVSERKYIYGIAYNVKLMDLRVLNEEVSNDGRISLDMTQAIRYAIANGADIISISYSVLNDDSSWQNAIIDALNSNISVVGSISNTESEGKEEYRNPAALTEVIAVGATNYDLEKADYSNYGTQSELMAPVGDGKAPKGELLISTVLNGKYSGCPGTSFAAPQVAAVIALMKSVNSNLSINRIREILHSTAIDLGASGWDKFFGFGLLNASAAVEQVDI